MKSITKEEALLRRIAELSFVTLETNLYLDGHPSDTAALAFFRKNNEELCRLTEAYEEEYGPLTASGDGYGDTWLWSTTKWPWEMEG